MHIWDLNTNSSIFYSLCSSFLLAKIVSQILTYRKTCVLWRLIQLVNKLLHFIKWVMLLFAQVFLKYEAIAKVLQ